LNVAWCEGTAEGKKYFTGGREIDLDLYFNFIFSIFDLEKNMTTYRLVKSIRVSLSIKYMPACWSRLFTKSDRRVPVEAKQKSGKVMIRCKPGPRYIIHKNYILNRKGVVIRKS
jgi:hypothetical protein